MQKSEKGPYYFRRLSLNDRFLTDLFKRRGLTLNDLLGNLMWLLALISISLIQKWRIRENKHFV